MEAASARPWTAVIASPFDGAKSKYNIAAAAEVTPAAQIAKAPSVKQRKEQWASSANKGVDYVRPSADAEPAPTQRGPSPQMLQGYFTDRHPMFATQQ